MEMFPKLKDKEVALLRAELKTGHVLDELFTVAVTNEQKVFTVFNNEDEGLQFAKLTILEKPDVEFVIYGEGEKVLFYLSSNKIESY
jgi:hypothetical protein